MMLVKLGYLGFEYIGTWITNGFNKYYTHMYVNQMFKNGVINRKILLIFW